MKRSTTMGTENGTKKEAGGTQQNKKARAIEGARLPKKEKEEARKKKIKKKSD